MTDAKERAELLARLEERVARLEQADRGEATPHPFRVITETVSVEEEIREGGPLTTDMWSWNDDEASLWNADEAGPDYTARDRDELAASGDSVATPETTTTDRAAAGDAAEATTEPAPYWSWNHEEDSRWHTVVFDDGRD